MNESDIVEFLRLNGGIVVTDTCFYISFRISGTGRTIRLNGNEVVLLNRDFATFTQNLNRYIGIPILLDHPHDSNNNAEPLTNDNIKDNEIIGTTIDSYILGSEIWGVGKIFNLNLLEKLKAYKSTSPCFITQDVKVGNDTQERIIEINHISFVENGHWDSVAEREPFNLNNTYFFNYNTNNFEKITTKGDSMAVTEKLDELESKKEAEAKADSETEKEKDEAKADNDAENDTKEEAKADSESEKADSESEKDDKKEAKADNAETSKNGDAKADALNADTLKQEILREFNKKSINTNVIDDKIPYCKADEARASLLARMQELYNKTDSKIAKVNVPMVTQRLTPEAYARVVLQENKDNLDKKYYCYCDSANISLDLLLDAVSNIENNINAKIDKAKEAFRQNAKSGQWEFISADVRCDRNF